MGSRARQSLIELNAGAILRVAACRAGPTGLAAVSTVKGLYLVRLADGAVERTDPAAGRAVQPYHDVKWAWGRLWAGGEDKAVDSFQVANA